MKHHEKLQRSRLPKGMVGLKPIPMRLTTDERETLERLALMECRSVSSMARLVFLKGLDIINQK
ncbi:putative bacteriophage protein [Sodalis praecaptivus]|uniref:Putative bacteriophage protein n=1 Tax=Sodalis praecaptivus TaxID=1239307 RepID=W0HYK1_9GAMM|nr:putative bacteriophage protein [Sodalis praecaptivus]